MKAVINGNDVTIYGFKVIKVNKDVMRLASCYVHELGIKQDYPISWIDIVNDDND